MAVETEFAPVLTRAGRDGSTLGPVLRQAWDGSNLATLSKGGPAIATGPHVSLIGHTLARN